MHGVQRPLSFSMIALSLSFAFAPAAQAQDSGSGVDPQFGTALDPGGLAARHCDPDGMTWLAGDAKRTPTGFLYGCTPAPYGLDSTATPESPWLGGGLLSIGYLHLNGDETNAQWRRYSDLDDGFVLNADFRLVRPDQGRYIELRATRISENSQFYRAVFGQAGKYRVQAFVRSQPNILSGNARSIWDGVGSRHLTLKDGLSVNGSTVPEVSAVSAAQPLQTLKVVRDKQGLGISYLLNKQWTASFNASHESREGARPFGGPFFFNYPFPDNGGVYEIPRPIDDSTVNMNAGLRFVGNDWRMQFDYSGSFFRNAYTGFDYEIPYTTWSVVGLPTPQMSLGEFSYEPDNDYHHVSGTFSRRVKWNGDFSVKAAFGTSSQNDTLLPPTNCEGQVGIPIPGFLYDCADWNTTASLSRPRADLAINTQRLDLRLVLQPASNVSWRSTAKFHREDYSGTYWAYNPLTGQYGYIAENGAMGSVVPGEMGVWDPGANASVPTRVRNLPLDKETVEASTGVNWRMDSKNTLGASYTFTRVERTHREFATTQDNALKLNWTNRSIEWLNFRANYAFLDRSGNDYNSNPYGFTLSQGMPGYVAPPGGTPTHTIAQLRKYDVGEREQHKIDLMATAMLPNDMTVSASIRGDWNDYDAQAGRQKFDTLGTSVQWEWQPVAGRVAGAWYGYDESDLVFANANDVNITPDPDLGGATYTDSGRWSTNDKQRNHYAGANWSQRFGKATFDASWNWTYTRGMTRYDFASADALAYPQLVASANGAFPPMVFRSNSLSLSLSLPINERIGVKLFNTYERANLSDWHYLGFDQTRVYDHRVYTDGGPMDYSVNMFGALLEVRL